MHLMNENCVNNCVRLANPSTTQPSNINVNFAKNETKQNPAVTITRPRILTFHNVLEEKFEFCCSLENCNITFLTAKGYAKHVLTKHGKNADEYPATILKVTKTEVKCDTAIRDSLNNTTENAEKVKTPFRNTKPKPSSSFMPSETPSNIRTSGSHNDKITTNSSATPYEKEQLGCSDVQEISDDDEEVPTLTAHLIKEGLQLAAKLSDHFVKHDPIGERAEKFQRDLKLIMGNYQELHNSLQSKTPPPLNNVIIVEDNSSDESDCKYI